MEMWTLQNAKNRFSAVVEAALSGIPQEVSRRGQLAVVVLSAEEYHRLLEVNIEQRESFAEHLLTFPGGETERIKIQPRDVEF